MNKKIVWFSEVDKNSLSLVGGKGANLGEMIQAGFPIPFGFIVTSKAYFEFINETKLDKKIKEIISYINYENTEDLRIASEHIRNLFNEIDFPEDLAEKIIDYYYHLLDQEKKYLQKNTPSVWQRITHKLKNIYSPPYLAVRSSATAEDLPTASFAGQQESYLNVRGEFNLINKIRLCWSSLFTSRALYYRHQQGFENKKVGLAVVCQRMVQSDQSGVAFTIDPVTNNKQKIVIEAIYGLGEYIVSGKVTPDHYEIDKKSFVILKKQISNQKIKLMRIGGANKKVIVPSSLAKTQKLSDEQIIKLSLLVRDIENHYFFPQDIEWAIENNQIFIVQSRPITTIKTQLASLETGFKNEFEKPILTGSSAAPGLATGPVRIVMTPNNIHLVKKGDILVAPQTNPDYVPAMKKAAGIITERGGRTSHAAIVSRELGIPAVVGVENATKILKNNQLITVDGISGNIYEGKISKKKHHYLSKKDTHLKSKTKIYVNLAEPEQAEKVSRMDVDGVGLLRAEFLIADIGIHPKYFVKNHQEDVFIQKLKNNLLTFVKSFNPRPVIYRATDFKTNEYHHLKAGEKFEIKEENPMIGFRGAYRYINQPEVFLMELKAIKKIWEDGYQNLYLMIPFLRTTWELIKIKEIINYSGLFNYPHFKLYLMVEVPAVAIGLEEFLKIGVDGVSIGTNDLTMLMLGVDRDNQEISEIYDERHPIIIKMLEYIVETCNKFGVSSSICGQAASDYPEVIEPLVKKGITSVSVNPDAVYRTRELIFNLEKKLFNKI